MYAIVWDPTRSELASFVYAALVVLGFLYALHKLLEAAQEASRKPDDPPLTAARRGLGAIIIGADNRVSTSKVQIALWTVSVVWGIVVLVFRFSTDASADEVFAIQAEYLILVGFPASAGLVAKVLTMNRIQAGTIDKSQADQPQIADIVSNDEGVADLGDWQYFLFNLAALAVYYRLFIGAPENGLPSLPDTVVALTGASAAIYTAKKTVEGQPRPTVSWARPSRLVLAPGQAITVAGERFVASGDTAPSTDLNDDDNLYWVALGSVRLVITSWSDTTIQAALPAQAELAALQAGKENLVVHDTAGRASDPTEIDLVAPAQQ